MISISYKKKVSCFAVLALLLAAASVSRAQTTAFMRINVGLSFW